MKMMCVVLFDHGDPYLATEVVFDAGKTGPDMSLLERVKDKAIEQRLEALNDVKGGATYSMEEVEETYRDTLVFTMKEILEGFAKVK